MAHTCWSIKGSIPVYFVHLVSGNERSANSKTTYKVTRPSGSN